MPLTRKILTLPGIDHSGKELYETPDVDEAPSSTAPEAFANPDIEVTRFDRKAALAQFIAKGPQVFEAYGEALEKEEGCQVGKVQVTLAAVTEELNGLLGKVKGDGESEASKQTISQPPTAFVSNGTMEQVLALDKRLATIEKAVGVDSQKQFAPLQETVSKLEASMKLLDPAALEELNRKVKQLERDMDKVIAKKQPYADLSGLEQRKRMEDMYDALQRCDMTAPQVPVVLNRLLSLKRLHDDADALRQALTTATEAEASIAALLTEGTALLRDVEVGMQENVVAMERNMTRLDARIAQLAAQMQGIAPMTV
eukprot:GGOE01036724.1.p1 GENE.GGOE01036724.1~~GGOE01036724.1.p1  ORF type:complete len:313 (-),score=84.37 GGOE01036724.1:102-1040(-)